LRPPESTPHTRKGHETCFWETKNASGGEELETARNFSGGDCEMKMMRSVFSFLVIVLFSVPLIHGQDLSKYRTFSFGMTLPDLSKQIDAKPDDVKVIHEQPALIEELNWWLPQAYGASRPAEPVSQILFSFYNGALYRMVVTYDSAAIKGLTDEDMIRVLSGKYGEAARPLAEVSFPTNPRYSEVQKVIARWETSSYSLNLFRSSSSNSYAIVMFTKQVDAQAAISIAESIKLEQREAPQKEASRVKKEAQDLEVERQKNIEALRP
jgi:hypothetical protein